MKKILSYIWLIILNLFVIVISIAIFNQAYSSSEVIIFSLLIMIYLSVSSFYNWSAITTARSLLALGNEFHQLKSLHKKGKNEFEEEGLKEADVKIKSAEIKYLIGSIFHFLIFVIAFWNLITAL